MFLVFDIGGTKMRLAVSGNGQDLDSFRVIPTPQSYSEAMVKFDAVYRELMDGGKVEKVAGGITGSIAKTKDYCIRSPHLPDWVGKPIRDDIAKITNAKVFLENDAAMVGLGEAVDGAGKGFDIIAYLTVSTGIGGARIVKQHIDTNYFGFEPGHHIIDLDSSMMNQIGVHPRQGLTSEFENLASGSAVRTRFGTDPENIHEPGIWDHINWILANGITNAVLFWSPEVVILGGGVVESGKVDIEQIKKYMNQLLYIFPEHPDIRKATLIDLGGLHGSLAYLRSL